MLKKAILAAILLAAVGGPAVLYAVPDYLKTLRQNWFSSPDASTAEAALSGTPQADPAAGPPALPLEGSPIRDLGEVLRFDVTTGWVLRRWPRVSTGLAELPLQGYRVPLVTGTAETDLAGSLTYYFDAQQKVQRIGFQGTTGNARELVKLVSTRYKFTRRLTNDPGLFVYEVANPGGRPLSELKIQSARVIKSSDARRRFDVKLVIERPNG